MRKSPIATFLFTLFWTTVVGTLTKTLVPKEIEQVKTSIKRSRGEARDAEIKNLLHDQKLANYDLLTYDALTDMDLQYERLEYLFKLYFDFDPDQLALLKRFVNLFADEDPEAEQALGQLLASLPMDLRPIYEEFFKKGLYANSELFQALFENISFRKRIQADLQGEEPIVPGTTLAHDYLKSKVIKRFAALYKAGREFGVFDRNGFTPLMKAVLKDFESDLLEQTKRLTFDSITPEETRLEWITALVVYGADPKASNGGKSVASLSRPKTWTVIKEAAFKLSRIRDRINAVFQDPRLNADVKEVMMGHFDTLKDDLLTYILHKYTDDEIPEEVQYIEDVK